MFWPLLLWFGMQNAPQNAALPEIRERYMLASTNENELNALYYDLKAYRSPTPTLLGYQGTTRMMMARHAYNPYSKLSYFNEGKSLLHKAITLDPENAELRLLRLTAQLNAPEFLNYRNEIERDKRLLLLKYPKISDPVLREMIYSVLTEYKLAPVADLKK